MVSYASSQNSVTIDDKHVVIPTGIRRVSFAIDSPTYNLNNSQFLASPILAGYPPSLWQPPSNGPAICRICYSTENSGPKTGEPLISPCHCKGTMGLYHRTCLGKWLAVSNKTCCEICQFPFQIKRTKRSVWEYLRDEDARLARRNLFLDILCFLLITPLVIVSSTVCVISSANLIGEENSNRTQSTLGISGELRFEVAIGLFIKRNVKLLISVHLVSLPNFIGLLFLSTVLITAFCIWLGVTVTFHAKALRKWQATHWDYKVIDQLSFEESLLINGFDGRGA
ncbi:RING-CH-type domain-containing protein [Meloidogyne graminicola]|uniref:RING-CH-type domain-containing protein n=1 Tax=Meloidogyne graminicola TaxID=189291 RepID=A0A8S9Z8W4_9BILA|nr:RING-CH-type domain-containing protein [Meloidogyne graminicola]